jgi:uroporphyrinogen decarboxylase
MAGKTAMTPRENWLRCIEFRGPEWIPVQVAISGGTWQRYGRALADVVAPHPRLVTAPADLPDVRPEVYDAARAEEVVYDIFGCGWINLHPGLEGLVVSNPLADWSAWPSYTFPDPLSAEAGFPQDWDAVVANVRAQKEAGQLTWGGADRFFERLHFLRGYENLMMDFADAPPQLGELIYAVEAYVAARVDKWISAGVYIIAFGDDLGLQDRMMVSIDTFRRWLRPSYERLAQRCRDAGVHVQLHSDGYTLPLLPELLDMGVSMVNPQDLVNGLDNIRDLCGGKVCVLLDIDRQSVLPFGTPEEVRAHIRRCVDVLRRPEGGLAMVIGIYPDVPLANIDAVLTAFEDFCLA